ncbi:somatomedin-B and thrombospondin type-1 domain-containing protein [Episyrphus balteatus]|uniref:somatomedin-B and thrombospondin type-1 domain-containing protein n=1 Tax=Episyrphus balteatus TaxID=286459 RepID=UPI002486C37C|nr:somatomedin-B and thrombospondin type-1 domain-containing protein [Episyrphus balteatus]XP_055846483.1 somatomedin-B and thrombospondin type-1 domain-containing protein [Episyrphus balteatus]XP_055846484.1 somatomedin-B and thrombospondin type-1 domain-containing protein [Episyrphus balteatus]XP_055846486.1 somatomedin-B and thrombospondin type-1 domain-containing protein [Episyrphus balteatus]XP_055846487.1 somatomedin-B and thrombospondin type-1 domain-containing protein [Episyrphus baltea
MARINSTTFICMCINLILIASSPFNAVSAGSCREAQLCCNGRDSSCVVQKAPINAIVEDLNDKPCYCDHACLKLGDCCEDFKNHCGVLDCQVSEWSQWSECDKSCGIGMMTRSRSVLQPSQNGGKHCPSLVQKRGCQGLRCHGHHDRKVLREMALLLPAELSKNHNFNDSSDTRRNLRLRYRASYKHNRDREHEYCVEYEVIKASKPCHKLTPFNKLLEGDRIIVRCDMEALIEDLPNFSQNIMSSTQTKSNALHNSTSRKSEITNNSAILSEDEEEDVSEDSEDYDRSTIPTPLTTTTTIHPSTTYHCRGEGLSGRTTRWSALPAPSCRGKWLRLTVGKPKKCSHPQFIFV